MKLSYKKRNQASSHGYDIQLDSDNYNLLSESTRFEGNITDESGIVVHGYVKGNITSKSEIIIGKSATITGDLKGSNILVYGKVNGNIFASENLILKEHSVALGDISAQNLMCENNVEMSGKFSIGEVVPESTEEQKLSTPPTNVIYLNKKDDPSIKEDSEKEESEKVTAASSNQRRTKTGELKRPGSDDTKDDGEGKSIGNFW
ncbi:MAG: polymer-forming cytoskeletal protein [Melioribacteraceae bacterium]|nr:polymer-forming cytoskeletal protein [Melioribacteraceae bacterium]